MTSGGSGGAGPAVRAVLALALAVGLAACGGGDDEAADPAPEQAQQQQQEQEAPAETGPTEPCGFLTVEEVTAAGIAVTDPQPVESATGGLACTYGDDPFEAVQVIVQPGGGQAYFDQSAELLPAAEPLPGLGDAAVLDASNAQQVTVLVLQGDAVLSVGGSVSPEDARSLAEKALARLS